MDEELDQDGNPKTTAEDKPIYKTVSTYYTEDGRVKAKVIN
ncbi:MAG: hypothetical protein ACK5MR_12695 [Cumulibacter sp.]